MKEYTPLAVPCEGWWYQDEFGRQPMTQLRIAFQQGRVEGTGADIVGLFTLSGSIDDMGMVALRKQYLGQHEVVYLGRYDGEGVLSGEWRIGPLRGDWLIRIRRDRTASTEAIEEYVPAASNPPDQSV